MFLIKSWSLEDCFPRLFLVAAVCVWSFLPGSNPRAFISDLGSLEINLYLEAKSSKRSPVWRDVPSFPQDSEKLFEPSESYKPLLQQPESHKYLSCSLSVYFATRLGNLWTSWRGLRRGQRPWGRALSWRDSSSCSPSLASAPPCHDAHMAQAVPWWEKRWEGKWGHAEMGTGISDTWLSIWGLLSTSQKGWTAVNDQDSEEITNLSILRKLIQWS